MTRFNQNKSTTKTINRAGGKAYSQTNELALASLLLTSFLQDKSYETGKAQQKRLEELALGVDPIFAAKAAIYARNEFGMRSVSHVVAGAVREQVAGNDWAKRFYSKVVRRPDDILEIVSYVGPENITHAMRKGFAQRLSKFDDYQISKYKGNNKKLKLVDVVNLVHAKSTSINKLMNGKLKPADTWETKVSASGKAENKEKAKEEAWTELLESGKIGYFALLRNLRNIENQAPGMIDKACELLTDEKLIRKSLVLPFRFMTADAQVSDRRLLRAISKAVDISCKNVPEFTGRTLIAVDGSGSMGGEPIRIASLFAAIMYKATDSDVIIFDTSARYESYNPDDSTMTIANKIMQNCNYGGTDFSSIFRTVKTKNYDRIFIMSDMQSWADSYWETSAKSEFHKYQKTVNSDAKLYSFDLQGYGDMQFPEQNVFTAAGWSDKVFDVIKQLESGKDLVEQIKAVEI